VHAYALLDPGAGSGALRASMRYAADMITLLATLWIARLSVPQPAISQASSAQVIRAISSDRIRRDVDRLAGFGTRHTLSSTDDPSRGIGAARRWLLSEFESAGKAAGGRLATSLESFEAPKMPRLPQGATIVNVVARLQGVMPEASRRVVYVVGHYDTINSDRMDAAGDAPGANDDASGTAVVLECARVLSGFRLDATVVFLCTAAEEQGLVGAKFHADALVQSKAFDHVYALSNDIVGDPSIPYVPLESLAGGAATIDSRAFVRVFSEGIPKNTSAETLAAIRNQAAENDSPSRQLARYVAEVARREGLTSGEPGTVTPKMVFRPDRFLRGGDHSAFNEAGLCAVRFTVPGEDYSRQHVNVTQRDGKPYGDVPSFVDETYVAGVARLNAASIVHLANAPSPPASVRLVAAELTPVTTLRFSRPPEPDFAGFEILIRETTDADWRVVFPVPADASKGDYEITLPLSKDTHLFAVRCVDASGFKSVPAFAWSSAK